MHASVRRTPSFIRTGQAIERQVQEIDRIYRLARELCPDGFPAEETRELPALYAHVPLGLVDALRDEIAEKLGLERAIFSRDRFSIHGCGPVGLHDDFFRFPYVYFVVIVAHGGCLGLVDEHSRAGRHPTGEIILLDPRRKHGLVAEGCTADEHTYERTHAPVHDEAYQFLFLDFDIRRPDLRARFRGRGGAETARGGAFP
jgi:hypothetical protein